MQKGILFLLALFLICHTNAQTIYFVSGSGNDKNPGTKIKPMKSVEMAVYKAIEQGGEDVIIEIRGGSYRLKSTIEVNAQAYKCRSLTIRGYGNEKVLLKGSRKISPKWENYKDGILKATIDLGFSPDQFFVNGRHQPMARYPNFDKKASIFNGTAADAISSDRVKSWSNPANGYIHALHTGQWGSFHYSIQGKKEPGEIAYEGGWQVTRPSPMHKKYRFVENVFEELDAPNEWYYDLPNKTLYYYPSKEISLQKTEFEISQLTDLIRFVGSDKQPIKNIEIRNIAFEQSNRSFMLTKEPLLRSDWAIYRGGAILLDGTENVSILNCRFSELGGHAVFMSNYNKGNKVIDCHIYNIGGNAIAFVGDPGAVRSPAFQYELFVPWKDMDYTPGPKTENFPQNCTASGNLIHDIGYIEKQVAGIQIEMASKIMVRHNSIYNVPRAGINVGSGCWGGHVIEHNDVFKTVLETGDHGAFNSWGRDRFWRPERGVIDSIVAARPGIELLDVIDPIVIRNNRFQCDHGWDIDLDDGSSNYIIYNNVCLSGGLKLREGYNRTVFNNILINNSFHPHVWLKNSKDVFKYNIVTTSYAPILVNNWGNMIDSNFFLSTSALKESRQYKVDKSSSYYLNPFVDAGLGNYSIKPHSPILQSGFKSFKMNFGVTSPALKAIAEKPVIKPLLVGVGEKKGELVEWLGGKFKNIETLGERSASGLHNNNGALLVDILPNSILTDSKLQSGDVIIKMEDTDINSSGDLLLVYQKIKWTGQANLLIVRNQSQQKILVRFNKM